VSRSRGGSRPCGAAAEGGDCSGGDDGLALFPAGAGHPGSCCAGSATCLDLESVGGPTASWADPTAGLDVVAEGRQRGRSACSPHDADASPGSKAFSVACVELGPAGAVDDSPARQQLTWQLSELPEADFDLSVVVPRGTLRGQANRRAFSRWAVTGLGIGSRLSMSSVARGCWRATSRRALLRDSATHQDHAAG